MKKTKRICLTLVLLTVMVTYCRATWSIIFVDPKTNQIGIAGASCSYSVYGIGSIVPGKGALIVQAMSNPLAHSTGLKMMMANASPDEILTAMKDPKFDPEHQQYAIICVNYLENPKTFTGVYNTPAKGALTEKGISVQGNTLVSKEELDAVLTAALKAQKDALPIEEVLMLALEAGARLGGDKRCGDTKASSAFLTVANPNDDPKNPYLNLVVYGTEKNVNAVEALRRKFDNWKAKEKK